ncbi:hypothetical protein BU17DRAFT_90658 [Hysterangium stoloniferum]|nr:hypothetical protein BU17DRAFT_90658 [Hysterangium stoloniferum]
MASSNQPSQALILVTPSTLDQTRPYRTAAGPGSTIARLYDWGGQKITHVIGRVAHELGKGPGFPTKAIEEAFGLEVNQTLKRLCDLHDCKGQPSSGCGGWNWDIDKLDHCCTGLIEYTSRFKTAETQLIAFKKILRVITGYPGLRRVFCRYQSIMEKDPESLWKTPDDDCVKNEWDEWKLFRQVAASCITEENLEVTVIVEKVRPNEFGKFSDHSESVVEKLAAIATDTVKTSNFVRIIAIGYLGGILRLPPFWSEERNKGMPAVKLLEATEQGIDLLLQAVLMGMDAWAKELKRSPIHQSDISWLQLSVNLMESVRGNEAALFLLRSTLAISQVTALRALLTEASDLTNGPAWIECYELQQSDVTTEPPESKYIYSRPAPLLRLPHMAEREVNISTGCPDRSDVYFWFEQLCNYAMSREYAHIIFNSRALELRRMKERDTSEMQEYFTAKIQHADGCTRYLRIERFPEGYIPTTIRKRYTSHVSSLLNFLDERRASDEVSTVSGWPRHDRVLEKVDVTDANITLLDLAIAAWVVRVNDDQYRLLSRACYWYSDSVLRVLEDAYRVRVDRSLSRDVEQAEEYGKGGIPLHRQRNVALIAEKFCMERDRVRDEVRLAQERRKREMGMEERQKLRARIEELEMAIQRK